jgi:hypothetical protein
MNETYQPDFVRDDTGDVDTGSSRVEVSAPEQTPGVDSQGEPGYDTADPVPTPAQKMFAALATVFQPQPKPTPEDDKGFILDTDVKQQAEDFVRFIATLGLKVLDTPARKTVFYTVVVANAVPTQIAGYQPNRKRLLILSTEANDAVGLGNDSTVQLGWTLPETTTGLEVLSQGEVWGITAAAETATLLVMAEHYA